MIFGNCRIARKFSLSQNDFHLKNENKFIIALTKLKIFTWT
jgi:hypothetical protein